MSSAGTVTRGDSRPGEVGPGRRLLLLSESAGLAAVLTRLLDRRDRITRTGWSAQATDEGGLGEADLVVLDVPRAGRAAACQQLRRRYHGPVVVLVERGDDGRGLPADQARTLLARPFSTDDLRAALNLRAPQPTAPPPRRAPRRRRPQWPPRPRRRAPPTPRRPSPARPRPWSRPRRARTRSASRTFPFASYTATAASRASAASSNRPRFRYASPTIRIVVVRPR